MRELSSEYTNRGTQSPHDVKPQGPQLKLSLVKLPTSVVSSGENYHTNKSSYFTQEHVSTVLISIRPVLGWPQPRKPQGLCTDSTHI